MKKTEPLRTMLMVQIDPDFLQHIKDTATDKKVTTSKYVRAVLAKATGYKEKSIV